MSAKRFENQWDKIVFLLKWIKLKSIYCQTMDYNLTTTFRIQRTQASALTDYRTQRLWQMSPRTWCSYWWGRHKMRMIKLKDMAATEVPGRGKGTSLAGCVWEWWARGCSHIAKDTTSVDYCVVAKNWCLWFLIL